VFLMTGEMLSFRMGLFTYLPKWQDRQIPLLTCSVITPKWVDNQICLLTC
jgi:hypothetical protein